MSAPFIESSCLIRSQFKNSDESLKEAEAKFKQGKYAEAEPLFLLALVLLERSLPEDHPDVLSCMEKLGDTFYASEKFKDAAPVYRRLVGIREKNPTAAQYTVSALFKIAKTHERLSQIDEAEEQYKRAVKLGEPLPGPLFANLCDAFAALLRRNSRQPQLASTLETTARERREADGNPNSASNQRSTLQIAAIDFKKYAADRLTEPTEEEAAAAPSEMKEEEEAEPTGNGASYDASQLNEFGEASGATATPQANVFDPYALDAIKTPKLGGAAPAAQVAEPSVSESAAAKAEAARPTALNQAGSFFKKKAEEDIAKISGIQLPSQGGEPPSQLTAQSGAPPSQLTRPPNQLSGNKAAAFSKTDLDSIGSPGVAGAKPAVPPKDQLDAIKPKSALDSVRAAAKTPPSTPATKIGAGAAAAAGAAAGEAKPYDPADLEAIKSPSTGAPLPLPAPPPTPDQQRATAGRTSRQRATVDGPAVDLSGVQNLLIPAAGLIILVTFFGFMAYFSLSNKNDETANPALDKYVGKTFQTADHRQTMSFESNRKGELISHYGGSKASQVEVKFKTYQENPINELGVLLGSFKDDVWLSENPLGFKTEQGGILYTPDQTETKIIDQMWQVADAAAIFYRKYGHYPRDGAMDPDQMKKLYPKLSFTNPCSQQDMLPEIQMFDWPEGKMPSSPMEVTEMETKWRNGEPLSHSAEVPGALRCAQLGWPKLPPMDYTKRVEQHLDDFFVEGYNQYGELVRTHDGKVFLISLKKGMDKTPESTPRLVAEKVKGPITVLVSPGDKPTVGAIIFKYALLGIVFAMLMGVWLNWSAIDDWAKRKKEANQKEGSSANTKLE